MHSEQKTRTPECAQYRCHGVFIYSELTSQITLKVSKGVDWS